MRTLAIAVPAALAAYRCKAYPDAVKFWNRLKAVDPDHWQVRPRTPWMATTTGSRDHRIYFPEPLYDEVRQAVIEILEHKRKPVSITEYPGDAKKK